MMTEQQAEEEIKTICWIPLGTAVAIVDLEDLHKVLYRRWYVGTGGYAEHRGYRKKGCLMHRIIADATPDQEVDHINRNRLDNRRSNLRLCNRLQNAANTMFYENTVSGLRGVVKPKKSPSWQAQIGKKYLGSFSCKYDAATAYNFAASEKFGEFAVYNTVPQPWLEEL